MEIKAQNIEKKLEYWQSQEGPRRALCKFAGQC